jgi:hypothetical protein
MQELGTIGQAIYMRLFFHFANLYDGHHKDRLTFPKRYDDICSEWLGGLTVLKFKSKIEREQLGVHLRQLIAARFLSSYHITAARSGEGFVITFRPGPAFFADYDRFYRRQRVAAVRFSMDDDRRDIAEPLKVAYLFTQKRDGRPAAGIPYVPSKDVETARQILALVPFDDVSDFIDYALAQAKKTRFEVQNLGGIRQYLDGYLQARERRASARPAQAAHEVTQKATQDRMDYDRFRRAEADRIFSSLTGGEQAAIEAAARAKTPHQGRGKGSLAEIIFGIDRARITAERHAARILSFADWKAQQR